MFREADAKSYTFRITRSGHFRGKAYLQIDLMAERPFLVDLVFDCDTAEEFVRTLGEAVEWVIQHLDEIEEDHQAGWMDTLWDHVMVQIDPVAEVLAKRHVGNDVSEGGLPF